MSILTRLWQAIKSLWERVPDEIREASEIAIKITRWLQKVVNSKEAKALVELTPTGIDNSILSFLQRILPEIEAEIKPVSEDLIEWLNTLPEESQKAIYAHIMGMITERIVGDITLSEAKTYSQIVFTKQKGE